ncbi:hypothetical protein TVAG_436610 [Trichomonas vaginalis G3]|uniref:Uncharacterized protein n=1 Tax=Trichomonas vaginalis (strain ATCC PRA-98 / G3) TaxID=412133 RepID=A2DFA9_TRIV3|nr:hypothetical protein TVAGG3_0565650 [Trichomonas vaginalis G3]EAY20837.1 hypothetical protein TVAG_436610 [Trichomonas vaginalis G3]KAI5521555.1 hypothetical protein TVAGG3_0565650 [Trichomonas vaginalis G3]|eukprot:XP_001581823.1 hypothetical protein [Trichomonas vaginalis G3]
METQTLQEPPKTEAEIAAKIAELQDTLIKIREGYRDLSNCQGEIDTKYNQKIEKATAQRLESLEKWRDCENEAALRLKQSQLVQIDNDGVHAMEQAKERIFQLMLLKYEMLAQKLPKAAKFFGSQNCPFIKTVNVELLKRQARVGIDLPNVPLMGADETRDFLSETTNQQILASINGTELKIGDNVFSVGTRAVIQIGKESPISGTITNIISSTIFFTPNEGEEISFSVQSINLGLVSFTK